MKICLFSGKIVKSFLCVFVIVLSIMSLIRTFAYYGRCLVLHNVRVHEIQLMKAIVNQWRVLDDPALVKGTVVKLCERYNLRVVDDHKAPLASLNIKYGIVSVSPIPSDRIDALEKRFRIIDSISDFYSFDWTDMLKVLYNALLQLPRKMSLFDGSSVPCVWSDMV